ncbi:hypothetical protein Scep_025955 [Stephania cephalantha]|uniref:Uncharacterized protein n=1 Tax=Stephania cephalantha TaxID=152367 RepID=A0AAP0HS17_9MAGN
MNARLVVELGVGLEANRVKGCGGDGEEGRIAREEVAKLIRERRRRRWQGNKLERRCRPSGRQRGRHRGLSCSGLGLGDDAASLDDGEDDSLLDGGELLESSSLDATEEVVSYPHLVEGRDGLNSMAHLKLHALIVAEDVVVVGVIQSASEGVE